MEKEGARSAVLTGPAENRSAALQADSKPKIILLKQHTGGKQWPGTRR